jgi:hypothetical protein
MKTFNGFVYRISRGYYNNLLMGFKDSDGHFRKPLVTHNAVVEYLRSASGLLNIVDVVTD